LTLKSRTLSGTLPCGVRTFLSRVREYFGSDRPAHLLLHASPYRGSLSEQLDEALGDLAVRLSPDDLTKIDQVLSEHQIAGTPYDARQMEMLDSERSGRHLSWAVYSRFSLSVGAYSRTG